MQVSPVIRGLLGLGLISFSLAANAEDLMEVYRIAIENDAKFQANYSAMQVGKQARPIAWATLLPTISGSAAASREKTTYNGLVTDYMPLKVTSSSSSVGLTLNQPIFRMDRIFNLRQANNISKQAESIYVAATQDLILRVTSAYFNVLSAQDTLHFTSGQKKAFARQLDQTKQRFNVGLIAITDVHEAQARFDDAVAQEIAAQTAVEDAFESLREITVKPMHELAKLKSNIALEKPYPLDMEAWVAQAQQDNASLRAADFASKASKEQYRAANAQHLPTLDLNGTYSKVHININNASGGGVINTSNTTEIEALAASLVIPGTLENQSAQLAFSMPIFQGGGTYANAKKAGYAFEESKHNYDLTSRATDSQTRQAFRGVTTQISQVNALKQAVLSNRSALKATTAAYDVGTRTIVDVLNAQSSLFDAEKFYAQARYQYVIESFKLKLAAGRLSPEDVAHINECLAYDVSYDDKDDINAAKDTGISSDNGNLLQKYKKRKNESTAMALKKSEKTAANDKKEVLAPEPVLEIPNPALTPDQTTITK